VFIYYISDIGIAVIYKDVDWGPDKAGAGIWGGIYLVIFGLLLIVKKYISLYTIRIFI
jgi:hypothetical protein